MSDLVIRRATEMNDLQAAAVLFLEVTEKEMGYGFNRKWHWDIDLLQQTYVDNPRQALFVAVHDERVVGCAAVRMGGPLSPPHPAALAERYANRSEVAQLFRVAVHPEFRRSGLARKLVAETQKFVRDDGGYQVIYLHTNTQHPAAEKFWLSTGAQVVFDARGTEFDADTRFDTVHFELSMVELATQRRDCFDAPAWFQRWEDQQAGFVPDRKAGFATMFDIIEDVAGPPARLLDLAAGPGSLGIQAKQRFPSARVEAVELDPMLVRLGRDAHGDALAWHELDLRDPHWHQRFEEASFDAVCSSTALHYLRSQEMANLVEGLARILRPGGVFCDYDTLPVDPETNPRLAATCSKMRETMWQEGFVRPNRDTWEAWWKGLRAEPGMEELWHERERRFEPRTKGEMVPLAQVCALLDKAGFAEKATFAQHCDKRLLVAVR